MRYLGLDLGTKTLGIALSDKTNTIAHPLKVVRYETNDQLLAELIKIINDKDITTLVLGLPKNMDNSEGFAVQRSLDFKTFIEQSIALPIVLVDERLTTVQAENILLNANMKHQKRKEKIDGLAACLILETYLKMKGD